MIQILVIAGAMIFGSLVALSDHGTYWDLFQFWAYMIAVVATYLLSAEFDQSPTRIS